MTNEDFMDWADDAQRELEHRLEQGWKPFEQLWNRNNMRQDYCKAMGKKEASEFLDALKKKLR